jgi:hypothetical protein
VSSELTRHLLPLAGPLQVSALEGEGAAAGKAAGKATAGAEGAGGAGEAPGEVRAVGGAACGGAGRARARGRAEARGWKVWEAREVWAARGACARCTPDKEGARRAAGGAACGRPQRTRAAGLQQAPQFAAASYCSLQFGQNCGDPT